MARCQPASKSAATARLFLQTFSPTPRRALSWRYPPFAGALLYLILAVSGYAGLIWFCAICGAALVRFSRALRTPSLGLAAPLLAMLAVPARADRTTPRADLFTSLLFAIFSCGIVVRSGIWRRLCGFSRRRLLLWVNLHPGLRSGRGIAGRVLAIEALDACFPERRPAAFAPLKRAWPWLVAMVLASLVNPWGAKIYAMAAALAVVARARLAPLNQRVLLASFQRSV